MLRVDELDLKNALLTSTNITRGETIKREYSVSQAEGMDLSER